MSRDQLRKSQSTNQSRLTVKAAGAGLDSSAERRAALEKTTKPIPKRRETATPQPNADTHAQPHNRTNGASGAAAGALLDSLTTRGHAADTKIIASIDPATRDALAALETAVFRAKRKRLIRSNLMAEAARRVAANPTKYDELHGTDLGARIPAATYADLITATNLGTPKLAYGPRVGSAIIEVVREAAGAIT